MVSHFGSPADEVRSDLGPGPAGAVERETAAPRDYRLDCAKALATSLVLVWHLQPLVLLEPTGSTPLGRASAALLKIFNYQVCLLAVPLFFLVSLHLLHSKIKESARDATARRIRRVGSVYLFWVACQFAIYYGIAVLRLLVTGKSSFSIAQPPHLLVMLGGPDLPIIGGSVLYFLFALIVLVALSGAFPSSRLSAATLRSVGWTVTLASVAYFEYVNLHGDGLQYWRVDNFILYVPLSFLLLQQRREILLRFAAAGCAGYVLFSLQDIYLRNQGQSCGAYSRVSIVCGTVALFCFFLRARDLPRISAVTFLSRYSLGIFATHKYWQLIVTAAFLFAGSRDPVRAGCVPLDLRSLSIAALSAALTLAAVVIGSHTSIRKFLQ